MDVGLARKRSSCRHRAILLILGVVFVSALQACRASEVRLISETDEQVVFEVRIPRPAVQPVTVEGREYIAVRIPGFSHPAEPGVPDLPWEEFLVALPPGTEALATVVEREEQPLVKGRPLPQPKESFVPPRDEQPSEPGLPYQHLVEYFEDPLVYEGLGLHPSDLTAAGASTRWRHFRVAPVALHPVRYDPEQEQLFWYPRIVVRVRFIASGEGSRIESGRSYPRSEPRWEPLFQRRILNYRRARTYKRAAAPRRVAALRTLAEPAAEIRLEVAATDLYKVSFEDLAATWDGLAGLDWDDLRLMVRDFGDETGDDPFLEWPVPYLQQDDGDGQLGAGDALIFYGQDAWDFFDLPPGDRRYLRHNVYWLECGGEPPASPDTIQAWHGDELTPLGLYERTIHYEENLFYMPILATGDESDIGKGPFAIHTDHYNWTNPQPVVGIDPRPIKVVHMDLPNTWSIEQLRVRLQGQEQLGGNQRLPHRPRLWLSRSPVPAETTWAFPGNPFEVLCTDSLIVSVDGGEIPSSVLRTGKNYLKIYLPSAYDGIDNVIGDGVGIDWVEVTYSGFFQVRSHRLQVHLDELTGIQQLDFYDLGTSDVLALDLSDPRSPAILALDDSLFAYDSTSSKPWELKMQLDFEDGSAPREILVIERAYIGTLEEGSITLRGGEPLTDFSGQDLVAIYPRRFASHLEPLLAHREDQGHNVMRAPVEDVFDTYSGGREHVFAIKRLVREMWRQSDAPPDYLLLVGDASCDIAGYALGNEDATSDTNYVPVMTVSGHYYDVGGQQIVSSEHWFVANLLGDWKESMSYLPDMHVGRLPCGSNEEVDVYVEKVLNYETADETAPWRARVLMHADDTFSSTLAGMGQEMGYMNQASERWFLTLTRDGAAHILEDSIFAHFRVDSLNQADVMDSVPELGRCKLDPADSTRCLRNPDGSVVLVDSIIEYGPSRDYGQDQYKDMLIESLSDGALIWAFQGHANRSLLTHEYVFQHRRGGSQDVFRLTNIDRPFIFMGYSCHLAEYAHPCEGIPRRGDALVEHMLFCCPGEPKAAIAAFASTDYELIGHSMEEKVFRVMFSVPPAEEQGHTRWRLGELCSEAKVLGLSTTQAITYTLLGDPALRVGVAPPVLRLSLNGVDWDQDEGHEYVSDRDDDTLSIMISLFDESHVTLPEVVDYNGAVPESLLQVVGEAPDDRCMTVEYRTQVQRRPYSITVRAVDYDGAEREVELPIPMSIGFFEHMAEEMIPLAENDLVSLDGRIAVTIRTGAHLAPENVELLAGGEPMLPEGADLDQEDGQPFVWTFRYGDLSHLPLGPVPLEVKVTQRDGEALPLAALNLELDEVIPLAFERAHWIPNPFSDESTLVYDLSTYASRVRLRVYTVSGRRICAADDLPASKGMRHFVWDGRDDDGDLVANGLYFYELTTWGEDGKVADKIIDKVVRAR